MNYVFPDICIGYEPIHIEGVVWYDEGVKKVMKQILGWGVGVLLGLVILMWQQWPDGKLHIVACDVGQGDAILVEQGFNQVLIDGGPSGEKVLKCLRQEMPFWDRRIELIVMTHSDFDHINGLADVIERYSVIEFLSGDGLKMSATLEHLREVLANKKIKIEAVEMGDIVRVVDENLGERLRFRVWWPSDVKREKLAILSGDFGNKGDYQILGVSAKKGTGQSNNWRSVVLELKWHNYRALFTGDADFQAEKEMLKAGVVEQVNYLKVGHHGSKSSSSLEFLEKLKPKVAVISVGKHNRYGHPTKEALERLKKVGAKIRRTDLEGKVEVVVDRGGV